MSGMKASFFESHETLRAWLRKNHASSPELWIGFYKTGTGRGGLTYRQALDEALAHGWIDGVRKTIDGARWTIRFTPRKAKSRWSRVNLVRMEELLKLGRVGPAGRRAYEARDRTPRTGYSYEHQPKRLAPRREKVFRADPAAWAFFVAQAPSYRQKALFWVESAAQEETRARRLAGLMAACRRQERLGPLAGGKSKTR